MEIRARVPPLNRSAPATKNQPRDGQLWLAALGLSVLLNMGLVAIAGWMFLKADLQNLTETLPPVAQESVATIYVESIKSAASPKIAAEKPQFARTSPDQEAKPLDPTNRIGERNTRATSNRAPDPSAEALPSQAGIERKPDQDIETTESKYQDGELSDPKPIAQVPEESAPAPAPSPQIKPLEQASEASRPEVAGLDDGKSLPPPREKLLEGPNPVDVQVPKEVATGDLQKRQPEVKQQTDVPKAEPKELPPEVAKPTPLDTKPAEVKPVDAKPFQGFQRKTAVLGSISRTGHSALDVDDSDLGRYQAKISRAVEQEWQRNCVRHRDFITPGFLTVRFFVEGSGKVKSVQFVGDMETGEVQKGFTLNSIRNAEIPAMPHSLKKAYEGDTLELVFRFYF